MKTYITKNLIKLYKSNIIISNPSDKRAALIIYPKEDSCRIESQEGTILLMCLPPFTNFLVSIVKKNATSGRHADIYKHALQNTSKANLH